MQSPVHIIYEQSSQMNGPFPPKKKEKKEKEKKKMNRNHSRIYAHGVRVRV